MPDPVVPGPPASVLAVVSNNPGSGAAPSNPAFTGRATFTGASAGAFPFLPSLMTEIVPMPQSAYLDADVEVGGDLTVDGEIVAPGVTDWLNVVTQYGADPTGTADSTAAIQAALNAVPVNGGTVYFPAGTYKISATLNPTVNGTCIIGAGWGAQIRYDGNVANPAIGMADTTQRRIFIRDLRITNTNASPLGTALSMNYFVDSSVERLLIDGATAAPNIGASLNAAGSYYNVVRDCRINAAGSSGACVYIDSGANSNVIDNCRLIGDASTTGVHANANGLVINHADMESTGLVGIAVGASGVNVTINSPYVQTLTTAITLASGCGPVTILGGDADGATADITDSGCTCLAVIGFRGATGVLQSYFSGSTSSGQHQLGFAASGSAPDVYLYRKATTTLQCSGSFNVQTNHRVAGLLIIQPALSSLGSGASQGLEIANATTPPSSNPTGGGVLYCSAGALVYRGSSGTTTTIAPA